MSELDPVTCNDCGKRMPDNGVDADGRIVDADGWGRIGLDGPTYLYCPGCREQSRLLSEMRARR